jgi:LysR family transcriptional regulator, nitrogen assimilation regulatory protein
VTVLPSVISANDIARGKLAVNPIIDPPLHIDCIVIQPARRTLTTQARPFLERFEAEVAHIHGVWEQALERKGAGAVKVRAPASI